jgi:hypothetical protein
VTGYGTRLLYNIGNGPTQLLSESLTVELVASMPEGSATQSYLIFSPWIAAKSNYRRVATTEITGHQNQSSLRDVTGMIAATRGLKPTAKVRRRYAPKNKSQMFNHKCQIMISGLLSHDPT